MKQLLFFQGLPGVGKTHLSKAFSEQTNIPRVDRDKVKSAIIERYSSSEDPYCRDPKYVTMANEQTLNEVTELLQANDLVVVDSYIPTEDSLKLLYQRFPKDDYRYIVINLENNDRELWKSRFTSRKALANQPNGDFEKAASSIPTTRLFSHAAITLDTAKDERLNINEALRLVTRQS